MSIIFALRYRRIRNQALGGGYHLVDVRSLLSYLLSIFVSHSEREEMSFVVVIAFVLDAVIDEFVGNEVEATTRTDYHHEHCNLNDEEADEMEKRHHYYSNTFLSVKYHVD